MWLYEIGFRLVLRVTCPFLVVFICRGWLSTFGQYMQSPSYTQLDNYSKDRTKGPKSSSKPTTERDLSLSRTHTFTCGVTRLQDGATANRCNDSNFTVIKDYTQTHG